MDLTTIALLVIAAIGWAIAWYEHRERRRLERGSRPGFDGHGDPSRFSREDINRKD